MTMRSRYLAAGAGAAGKLTAITSLTEMYHP
jgi:hypothetical protein